MSSERPEDVEAFARLIAGFHDSPDTTSPPAPDDPGARATRGRLRRTSTTAPTRSPTEPAGDTDDDLILGGPGADSLDTPASWDDKGHFVPPDPPPLSWPPPVRLAAWLGVLVGPVLLMVTAAPGWTLPQPLLATIIVGFVGGVIYLIATMDDSPPDPYDPGNGAVV